MSLYVLEMSTDEDIQATNLAGAWGPVAMRANYNEVFAGGLNIPAGATIVIIAHGNNNVIGNAGDDINIEAPEFLYFIHTNMFTDPETGVVAAPDQIYISTCGENGMAQFADDVSATAQINEIWAPVRIFGHGQPVAGDVQPREAPEWQEIFNGIDFFGG